MLCSLLHGEASGQTPSSLASSVHFYVCPSRDLSQPDRAVLATLNDDIGAAVGRAGGIVFATARRGDAAPPAADCTTAEAVASALQQYRSAPTQPPIFVLLDSPALDSLLRRQGDLVRSLRLRAMNLRLFTRPIHVFENEAASNQNQDSPNVGVYADQEIAADTLKPLLSAVLKKPAEVVPFENIAEMARCLALGQFTASRSQCPRPISWAVIVEQDASLTLEDFDRAYRANADQQPPKTFVPANLPPDIHVSAAGLWIVPQPAIAPAPPGTAPSFSMGIPVAAVPRTDGPVLLEQQARETPDAPAGFLATMATIWARLPSVGTTALAAGPDANGVLPKHPYPIVLTNQDPPDNQLRGVLSDSYLRALHNSAIGSPCSGVAERLHRAFLFNAHLDDPGNGSKKLSLGSELALTTRGARRAELLSRLQLSPDLNQWPQNLAAAGGPAPACPVMPNERFPEVRLNFASPGLTSQYRAIEHLRRGNLDGAAACLRMALAESATPNCHKAERSTYSVYYNPYFYFAVQQVTGGRPPR